MPPTETRFATTLQTPLAVRLLALAIAVVGLAIAARTTITSTAWIGRVFPGFMILDNGVIASVGLAHWTSTALPDLYQSEVLAVDGQPIHTTPEAYAMVAAQAPGTPVEYRLRRNGTERVVRVATERFEQRDWFLLHGLFLLNGVVFLFAALAPFVLRPDSPAARGFVARRMLDRVLPLHRHGPLRTGDLLPAARAHRVGAACRHVALRARLPRASSLGASATRGWLVALTIAVAYEVCLYSPVWYSRILTTNMLYLAVVAVFFCLNVVVAYVRSGSQLVRQRVRVILVGALFGFAVPAVVLALRRGDGGRCLHEPGGDDALRVRARARLRDRPARPLRDRRDGEAWRLLPGPDGRRQRRVRPGGPGIQPRACASAR